MSERPQDEPTLADWILLGSMLAFLLAVFLFIVLVLCPAVSQFEDPAVRFEYEVQRRKEAKAEGRHDQAPPRPSGNH